MKDQFNNKMKMLNEGLIKHQALQSELFPYNGYIKDFCLNDLVLADILAKANQPKKVSMKDLLSFVQTKKKPDDLKIFNNNSIQLLIKK